MPDFRAYVRANLPPLGLGPEREAEIAEELSQQLEEHYERARTEGGSDEQAWERIRQQVPSWEKLAGEIRAVEKPAPKLTTKPPVAQPVPNGKSRLVADFFDDVRFGLRLLVKSPGFSVPALLTLALAIGVNATLFGVVRKVLIEPLPFPDADRIVTLWEHNTNDGIERDDVPPANFLDWVERQQVFESIAASNPFSYDYLSDGEPEKFVSAMVTEGFFDILGVPPLLGRTFVAQDHRPGRGDVAVLTHGFWRSRFGADPSIIGRVLVLSGKPFTVVGVLPPEFELRLHQPRRFMFTPQVPAEYWKNHRRSTYLKVVARLKPGVTLAQAQANMDAIAQQLAEELPQTNTGVGVSVVPLREHLVGAVEPVLLILMAAAGLVLLIASTNVANLTLARGMQRQRELAVRLALGSGRGRLTRQLLTESGVLACAGCLLGLLFSFANLRLFLGLVPAEVPRLSEAAVDGWVLAFGAAVTLLTVIIVGAVPAFHALRVNPHSQLREGVRASGGPTAMRARRFLLVTQVCLAVVLLVGAGLLLRSLDRLLRVEPGYTTERVVFLQQYVYREYHTDEQQSAYVSAALDSLNAVPGVRSAAAAVAVPLVSDYSTVSYPVLTDDQAPAPNLSEASAYWNVVSERYFETWGIPLIRGRVFNASDSRQSERVVVINEAMARRFWPGRDPLGDMVSLGSQPTVFRVIGIVGNVRHRTLLDEPRPEFYQAFAQHPSGAVSFLVRTDHESAGLIPALTETLWKLNDRIPFYQIETIEGLLAGSLAGRRFQTIILSAMALLALVLAAVGIYGVISFAAISRTKEVGIRMALGATAGAVVRMFIREGAWITAAGIAVGAPLAFALTLLLRSQLYEISPADPLTYGAIGLLLLGVAVCASFFPAFRAARADPVGSLRTE
jgi:putative ABC transport system permease protein